MTQAPRSAHEMLLLLPNLDGRLPPSRPRDTPPAPPADLPLPSEPLTWEQICARYPSQWVCLVEIDAINDTDFDFRTARVVGHGKTRREPLDQAKPILEQYAEFGHFFTGDWQAPTYRGVR